jgi:hypothetical protein
MGIGENPYKAVLFIAVLFQNNKPIDDLKSKIVEKFGPIDAAFGSIPFSHSAYYNSEMGADLQKVYFTFEKYFDRGELAAIKEYTNNLESEYKDESGNRTVNIDPGYITRDKLVLASTKDFYHRIYIGNKIFAEVTLHYRHGAFRFFSWTYPDYKEPGCLALLEKARAKLVKIIRL